jgi:Mrp family chromosome partitioning ATPase
VRRTLGDPIQSQSLAQLAERLERDIQQTGSKSLLFVGVGSQSTASQTLLYVAPLLSSRLSGEVLLVDADVPRRLLTEGLELGRQAGLTDALSPAGSNPQATITTSFDKLHVLPAGGGRHVDLSAAGPGLELLLERLAGQFACVLIDGGSTCDLASSALARVADAAYFVVKLGTVEVNTAQAALRDFRAAGARVLGCIAT